MKPELLILAAGVGSRYGSLKQIDQFGPSGETITDYSIYDAVKAGFGKIIFVISPSMEEEFTQSYIKKFPSSLEIDYVIQGIDKVFTKVEIPEQRQKPWGTAHAILMGKEKITQPFAVINADDFYGRESYEVMFSFLNNIRKNKPHELCLAGYPVENVLSDNGAVSRGVCTIDSEGFLSGIVERTKIRRSKGIIKYFDTNEEGVELLPSTLVSMNMFGLSPEIFEHLERYFKDFILEKHNDLKAELYLPLAIDLLTRQGIARVKVLKTNSIWFGVTYKEDKPLVREMIHTLVNKGVYPEKIWD